MGDWDFGLTCYLKYNIALAQGASNNNIAKGHVPHSRGLILAKEWRCDLTLIDPQRQWSTEGNSQHCPREIQTNTGSL
jgi:hypothetical protein